MDRLRLRIFAPRPPGPGEVLIEVRASGVNFRDVLKTLALYPGLDDDAEIALGDECAGTVLAISSRCHRPATRR